MPACCPYIISFCTRLGGPRLVWSLPATPQLACLVAPCPPIWPNGAHCSLGHARQAKPTCSSAIPPCSTP